MRSKRKIAAAALLAFVICLFAPGVSAFAAGGTVVEVSTKEELKNAFQNASNATNSFVISLKNDIIWGPIADPETGELKVTGLILSNGEVTLVGNGHTISDFTTISLGYGAVLNLGDGSTGLTISGSKYGADNTKEAPGILSLESNAQCNMYNNVMLCKSERNNYFGGGVTIGGQSSASNKAVFHMYGGTIDNCGVSGGSVCYGGGVSVCNGGTFIMDGGTISNCYAWINSSSINPTAPNIPGCGGGVFVGNGSTFIMNGGTIAECEAFHNGGGIAVYTSKVGTEGVLDSKFTMNGGTVTGCYSHGMGAGVFATGRQVFPAELAAQQSESGKPNDPGVNILGGTIANNESGYFYGGGIGLLMLKNEVQIKNTTITGNYAAEGGGIGSLLYWTHFNVDNCSITGNNAQVGGGIAIDGYAGSNSGNKPIATVSNSSIGNNLASLAASDVYVYDAEMHLCSAENAGIVYTNTAPSDLTNRVIEQWYVDGDTSRFVNKAPSDRVAQTELDFAWSSENEYMLIAAPTPDSPYGAAGGASFVLTKGFEDSSSNSVGNISGKLSVDPQFTISKLTSFNRVTNEGIPDFEGEFPAIPGSYTIQVSSGLSSVTIPLPDYSAAGVGDYWYTITESDLSGIAGLSNDAPKYLHVQVVWHDEENETVPVIGSISLHKTAPSKDEEGKFTGEYTNDPDNKTTGFTNIYNAGKLVVTKHVSGNMADPDKLFAVTVTLDSDGKTVQSPISYNGGFDSNGNALDGSIAYGWDGSKTIQVYLKHDSTLSIDNIPYNVTYTVVEEDYGVDGYTTTYEVTNGESDEDTVRYNAENTMQTGVTGSISDSSDNVTITNTKNTPIDVGVTLDNAPFVILLAGGVVILAVLLLAKRRRKNVVDEDI